MKRKQQEIKNICNDYIDELRNSDFGWLNFLSGIMVSASVNIFTGYCVTKDPSCFQLLASICALVASLSLFLLHQRLNYILRSIRHEIDLYGEFLTSKDRDNHEKNIWKEDINDNRLTLLLCVVAFIIGILGMIVCLVLSYQYYNIGSSMECCDCVECYLNK